MAKKVEKVINYERELPGLLSELDKKISSTTDRKLLEQYKGQVWALIVRQNDIKSFKALMSHEDILGEGQKRKIFEQLIESVNLATFGGFDCFYMEDVKQLINDGKIRDKKRSIDMLINEDHLRKLQTTVESMSTRQNISFISYVDEDERDRYAIWENNSPLFINLIPFRRTEDKNMELNGVEYKPVSKEDEHGNLPFRVLKRKMRA